MFPDSFFAPDSRLDFGASEFSGLNSGGLGGHQRSGFPPSGNGMFGGDDRRGGNHRPAAPDIRTDDDGGAVVVDNVPVPSPRPH